VFLGAKFLDQSYEYLNDSAEWDDYWTEDDEDMNNVSSSELYENLTELRKSAAIESPQSPDVQAELHRSTDGHCDRQRVSKSQQVVEELWQTEKAYVTKLRLISVVSTYIV
jgi:hypothetical protein